ncbi:hypothetical protein A176_001279 [Myxococcus hansupus]|uniref:Uncharacterized protein n=1 Tax=Pseudomyxococcus hansupus TaxID=1297742 RepID=A0A0H4X922_9BACT|nr:hypothetical protein A176_001279 [Myxococcus hansupus]
MAATLGFPTDKVSSPPVREPVPGGSGTRGRGAVAGSDDALAATQGVLGPGWEVPEGPHRRMEMERTRARVAQQEAMAPRASRCLDRPRGRQ